MATITGLTAARMLAIEAETIVDGDFDSTGHLILQKHDGTTLDAGVNPDATEGAKGLVELATSAEVIAGTDVTRVVTPAGLAAVPGSKVRLISPSLPESETSASYPTGISTMYLTTGSGWSVGGGFGTAVTVRLDGDRVTQTFYMRTGGATGMPKMWIRQSHSSDGGGGWTAWQQVTTMIGIAHTSYTQASLLSTYPVGQSRLFYSTTQSTAWDFAGKSGEVLTYYDGFDFARQDFLRHGAGTTPTERWVRTANVANGWTPWQKIVFEDRLSGMPKAMASGRETVTPVANTQTTYAVTFPAGRFTVTPNVVLTADTTVMGSQVQGISVNNISTTGFTIYVLRTNATNTLIQWIATQF